MDANPPATLAAKTDTSRLTLFDPQAGQGLGLSLSATVSRSSKSCPHLSHRYSKIGIFSPRGFLDPPSEREGLMHLPRIYVMRPGGAGFWL